MAFIPGTEASGGICVGQPGGFNQGSFVASFKTKHKWAQAGKIIEKVDFIKRRQEYSWNPVENIVRKY